MKQYKKCGYCKAFISDRGQGKCDLGYKTKGIYFNEAALINMIPLEPCEKPLTTKKFAEILIFKSKLKTNANN